MGRERDILEKLRAATHELRPDCKCKRFRCFENMSEKERNKRRMVCWHNDNYKNKIKRKKIMSKFDKGKHNNLFAATL